MNAPPPSDAERTDLVDPWSRLWNTGVLHSCATGIDGNYDGPTLAFWKRQFQSLHDGAKIVDIGTGNGPLLLMALQHAEQCGIVFQLHGVDIADINPAKSVPGGTQRFAGIQFHPRTSACCLPFADGEVDLICSQFGFEYAPRDAAINELSRVAHQFGRLAFVLHSDDSIIAKVSSSQREGYRFLREESAIIEQARAMIPILFHARAAKHGDAFSPAPGAESTRLAFNRSGEDLMDAMEHLPYAQILKTAAQQIRAALEHAPQFPRQADEILRRLRENIRDEEMRVIQQQDAQLSSADVQALANRLSQHHYHVQYSDLEQQPGVKIGCSLEAIRA